MADSDKKVNTSERGKKIVQNLMKVICLLVAFVLWIYVMMVESPSHKEVFTNIEVTLVKTSSLDEYGQAVYSGNGALIDVTLSGKKSVLSKLSPSDIVATADISAVAGTSGRVECKITVDAPADCKVEALSRDSIPVYIDNASQTTVSLYDKRINSNLPEGAYIGDFDFPVDKITVTGPSLATERVSRAIVEIDLSGVTTTKTFTETVVLVDESGNVIDNPYLDYYPKEITFTLPVFKTVSVKLDAYFKYGFLGYDNTEVRISPETVEVTGDADIINRGNLIESIELDEKNDFSGNRCSKRVVLNAVEGVTLSAESAEVTAIVGGDISTRMIIVSDIRAENAASDIYYTYVKDPITVTLMGSMEALSALSANEISLVIDLSPYDESNIGTFMLRAEVKVDSLYKDQIIELGSYRIPVTFTSSPTSEQDD